MDSGHLDLGNGEAMVIGTAADMRAAADYLEQHYPGGGDGPRLGPFTGPVLNMSNYRVRQVLALGPIPERQLRFLLALATWMGDDTRTARVGLGTLIEATGSSHNTVRRARRELEADGKLGSERGNGRGNLTLWITHCLPEKGTNNAGTLYDAERVPTGGGKGYQPQTADLQEPERELNRIAKSSGGSLTGACRDGNHPRSKYDPECMKWCECSCHATRRGVTPMTPRSAAAG